MWSSEAVEVLGIMVEKGEACRYNNDIRPIRRYDEEIVNRGQRAVLGSDVRLENGRRIVR